MYTSERLRNRLESGEHLLGLSHHYPCASVLESMCAGWDFVWIDAQHGQHTYESALNSVRIAQGLGLDTLLRVESRDPDVMCKYADTGTSALMIPMVDTEADAREAVQAVRYPPQGERSYAARRLVDLVGADYHLKTQPFLVAQIETPEAVKNLETILAVEGIDAVFFSPDDLRLRSGIAYDVPHNGHPLLTDAMHRTAKEASAAGKFAGVPAPTPALLRDVIAMGFHFSIGGGDAGFVRTTARQRLEQLRPIATNKRAS
jgi:4-hydroxy-2-oxoheptanedioate aldolase